MVFGAVWEAVAACLFLGTFDRRLREFEQRNIAVRERPFGFVSSPRIRNRTIRGRAFARAKRRQVLLVARSKMSLRVSRREFSMSARAITRRRCGRTFEALRSH